jgi:TolB protein
MFRLSDRIGRLIIRSQRWLGLHLKGSAAAFGQRLSQRAASPSTVTESAHAERRISSLSMLILAFLVSLVLLIYWATSPGAQDNPVFRFLAVGPTPAAQAPPQVSSSGQEPAPNPPGGGSGTLAFAMLAGAQRDLFALPHGASQPIRLTDNPADDRDPAWSPDGTRIAFSSRRDGNWELYVLALRTGEITRVTYDLAYEGEPAWSPDSQWLVYEAYYEGNLDIYIIKSDGAEGPYQITRNPGPDYDPAWSIDPAGGRGNIAYVSLRDGEQDIYILPLDNPDETSAVNITRTAGIQEMQPAWSADGMLAYSAVENGLPLVYTAARTDTGWASSVIGQGHSPAWSPDGSYQAYLTDRPDNSLLLSSLFGQWEGAPQVQALSAIASTLTWSSTSLPAALPGSLASASAAPVSPAYQEELVVPPDASSDAPYRLVNLQQYGLVADYPHLSDRVDGSFSALRSHINQLAGWDFLGRLDSVMWNLEQRPPPGQDFQNWHKAGRAIDIAQEYALTDPPQIELVPELIGPDLHWRIYVRCAIQDGSLGEPLRSLPWDLASRNSGDASAYENGGSYRDSIPSGYYVDFTQAAHQFGWHRIPSDSSWRSNWPGVLFWQYEKRDGLDWWSAMLELYPEAALNDAFGGPLPPED